MTKVKMAVINLKLHRPLNEELEPGAMITFGCNCTCRELLSYNKQYVKK